MMNFLNSQSDRPLEARGGNMYERWFLAVLGVLMICCESTEHMGAAHTVVWIARAVQHFHLASMIDNIGETNHYLRKTGHFLGYGALGLCFSRGWLAVVIRMSRKTWSIARARAGGYGIAATAVVASLDEIHQSFLPGRSASGWDVLLDTSGAVTLVTAYFVFRWVKRRQALDQVLAFRSLLQRGRQRRVFMESLRSFESANRRVA